VAYVVPDVIVRKHRGQWSVQLNPAVVPKLRLNHVYAQLFQRHRSDQNAELGAHLNEARWTLRNVEQRFSTILDVAQAIVRRQKNFLEYGAMAMRPLGLKEIAEEVGVHESTVSRVTNNKYMSTPVGVFELKYFFSRAMVTANGSACSGTAIRGVIKDIIEAESADIPLSDAEITRQLAQQGLVVARRTSRWTAVAGTPWLFRVVTPDTPVASDMQDAREIEFRNAVCCWPMRPLGACEGGLCAHSPTVAAGMFRSTTFLTPFYNIRKT
jgi:RNA polymerase sigma-54 factor